MNHIYKNVWSKVKNNYVAVSEIAKGHGRNSSEKTVKNALAAVVATSLLFGGYAGVSAADTTAGAGNGVAIGTGSSAPNAENVAIGKGASISYSSGNSNATGDIVIGNGAKTNNYISQGGGIAIGSNSFVENMLGGLERTFDFNQAGYDKFLGMPYGNPKDVTKMVTGVAIGQNTYARSGSVMLGTHNYKGELGDVTVDSSNTKANNMSIFSTTLGSNSYTNGLFSSVTGAYSIASSDYNGGANTAAKNFGANIYGSLNSIESATSSSNYSGIASSVIGTANRTANSNGALILGAGNEITNSITTISAPTSGADSAKELQTKLMNAVKSSASGGATLAIGGGNKADYTQKTAIIGVNNTITGTADAVSTFNMINGYNNKASNVKYVTVIGSDNNVADVESNVILGNKNTVSTNNTFVLGHNVTSTAENSVFLGNNSAYVASGKTSKGLDSYTSDTVAGKTVNFAGGDNVGGVVSVGSATETRRIQNVSAGLISADSTDAINGSQLYAVAEALKATAEGSKGSTLVGSDKALSIDKDNKTLNLNLKDTAGNEVTGSVDLTDLASAVDTDTKTTIVAGDNVTVEKTDDSTESNINYKVSVKADGKVESGNTGLVSGGTVYNETRVTSDGNYIKSANSAAENLTVLDTQVGTNTQSISNLNVRMNDLGNRVDRVGAGAAALAALHPIDFDPEDKWNFAAGYGNYKGANAAAVGAFYRPNEDTMFSIGGSFGGGENMINAGVSIKLGKGNEYMKLSRAEMAQKLDQQNREIQEMKAKDAARDAQMQEVLRQLEILQNQAAK